MRAGDGCSMLRRPSDLEVAQSGVFSNVSELRYVGWISQCASDALAAWPDQRKLNHGIVVMPDTPKKKIRISNRLSHSAIRVFPARRNEKGELILGAQATAFFWTNDGIVYVITNWHNVTAWDPIKDRALSEIAFTPTCLDFSIELARDAGEGTVIQDRKKATLDLF